MRKAAAPARKNNISSSRLLVFFVLCFKCVVYCLFVFFVLSPTSRQVQIARQTSQAVLVLVLIPVLYIYSSTSASSSTTTSTSDSTSISTSTSTSTSTGTGTSTSTSTVAVTVHPGR